MAQAAPVAVRTNSQVQVQEAEGHDVPQNVRNGDGNDDKQAHQRKRLRLDVPPSSNTPAADHAIPNTQGPRQQAMLTNTATLKSNLWHNIEVCCPFITLEHDILTTLHNQEMNCRALVDLEEGLLDLASYPKCCDGIFYLSAFQVEGQVYMRYIESGSYKGSFSSVRDLISENLPTSSEDVLWSQVYNEEDVEHKSQELSKERKKRLRPDIVYSRHLSTYVKSVKTSITKLLEETNSSDECKLLGMIVHTKYAGHQQVVDGDMNDRWYIHCSGKFKPSISQIEEFFQQYPLRSQPHDKRNVSFLLECRLEGDASLQIQCDAVSLLPNYPKSKPKMFKFEHKFPVLDRCPHSTRGKIIWARARRDRALYLDGACKELCTKPTAMEEEDVDMDEPRIEPDHQQPRHPVNIQERTGPRQPSRKLTLDVIQRALQNQLPAANMSAGNSSLFNNYCTQLVEHGSLYWRYSSAVEDIFMMNDIDDSTGLFKPTDYVHCRRILVETGYHYVCDCGIYRELVLESEVADLNVEDGEITCMHCRLLKDETNFVDNPATQLQHCFSTAKNFLGKGLVTCPSRNAIKFSVLLDDTCTFVHLSYMERTKKNIISCQLQRCKIGKGSKRQVCVLSNGELCPHLKVMKDHYGEWEKYLQKEDSTEGNDSEDELVPNDNEPLAEPLPDVQVTDEDMCFDVTSGLYTFKCRSTHPPVKHGTPQLRSAVAERMTLNDRNEDCIPRVKGCLKGPKKIPPIPEAMCTCGAGWTDTTSPTGILEFDRTMILYTMNAPVEIYIYKRFCASHSCEELWDEGRSECIHVSTINTCAGDEIGWYFIHTVMTGRQSFTGFCSTMDVLYNAVEESRSFMSPSVFIQWWFSWAAKQKVDFRKPCDVCKTQPKVLACDGTKIGIAFRHQEVTAIETPDTDAIIETPNRRNDRCYMKFITEVDPREVRAARDAVVNLAKHVVGGNKQALDEGTINELIRQAYCGLPKLAHPAFQRLLQDDVSPNERKALSDFFLILASSSPVSSIIPYKYAQDLCLVIYHITKFKAVDNAEALYNRVLQQMRQYSPEMRELFAASAHANDSGCGAPHKSVTNLLLSIIKEVRDLHRASIPPEQALPQAGTYNPPKYGRAYYFTPSGQKLRQVRGFSMDKEQHKNHDDPPNENELCTKVFPQVGKKGTSYLFLWFCPLHGHCYGFHIIPGSEGRKDPAASLYTHLEHPPEKICYDFACSLEEYCLNRESGFYKDVQFSHDIFHGYSHKCSTVYEGSRLLGSEKINSEIAEQFNSFIQCIKYSARQMTQSKFVFFLQFFINIWNNKKAEKHKQRLRLALLGHQ